jgi:hypothetical protein
MRVFVAAKGIKYRRGVCKIDVTTGGYSAIYALLEKWKKVVELPMKSGRTAHCQNPCCCINLANPLLYIAPYPNIEIRRS